MIKALTNNKQDWQRQVFKINERSYALKHVIGEIGMCAMCAITSRMNVLVRRLCTAAYVSGCMYRIGSWACTDCVLSVY